MERHDEPGDAREAEEALEERAQHKHPAGPEQTDSGFAEGIDREPDPADEELGPDYARGLRTGPESETEHHPRFSEGIEEEPDTPEKNVERRFSEGVERSPTSE